MKLGKLGPWCCAGALMLLLALSLGWTPALAQDSDAHGTPPSGEMSADDGGNVELETTERKSAFVDFFEKGGDFMWALLLTAVLALAVILERVFTLQRAHTNTRRLMAAIVTCLKKGMDGIQEAQDICMNTRGPIAAILHAGLSKVSRGPAAVEKAIENSGAIEMAFLQRGLPVLATVANVAPLLGFLGTVAGMIHAFEAIAAAEQVSAKVVASGISEALITTMTGLIIAIPTQAMYNFFTARIDRFVLEMEETSVELLDALTEEA